MNELNFKQADINDVDIIISYIKKIADYEKMSDQVQTKKEDVIEWMFNRKVTHCLLIKLDDTVIGFALYFFNYSTFVGKGGLYLEDLYIDEQYRHKGYGKKTFIQLAKIAQENNCGRMEWVCLKWNQPSIDFYKNLNAFTMDEWHTFRLTKDNIDKLANMK